MRKLASNAVVISLLLVPAVITASPVRLRRRPHQQTRITTFLPHSNFLTIPASTQVPVRILSGVETRFSRRDDPVVAQLTKAVYVRGKVALPVGTLFEGHVTEVHPARRYSRSAELAVHFESVMLPTGEVRPISAIFSALDNARLMAVRVNSEGQLRAIRPPVWKRLAGGFIGAGGFAIARVAFAGAAGLAAGLPAGGAALVGYELLWRRGREINLPPSTGARIRLINSLTVNTIA